MPRKLPPAGIEEPLDLEGAEEAYEFEDLPGGYLSASRITKYLNCGEAYRRTYVDGKRGAPSARMALGSTVHKLAEIALRETIHAGGPPPMDYALGHADTAFDAAFSDVSQWEEDESPGGMKDQSVELYRLWHKVILPGLDPVSVEEKFTTNIAGAKVLGFIDLINLGNSPEVIDLKVVKRAKSEKDVNNSLQLAVYSLATGIPRVGFHSLVKNKTPKAVPVMADLNPGQLKWAEE